MTKIADLVEIRVTLGNVLSICVTLVSVVWFASTLSSKVDDVADSITIIPNIVQRVSTLETSMAGIILRADTGRDAREKLETQVNALAGVITDVKLSLVRIEEKLGIPPR